MLTIVPTRCPDLDAAYSGSLDSSTGAVTLSGPVNVYDNNCDILVTFPITVTLTS